MTLTQVIKPFFYEIANLSLNDLFCNREKLMDLAQEYSFEDIVWILEMGKNNFEEFQLAWIMQWDDNLLETISKNKEWKQKIAICLKEGYLEGELNDDIIDKYFKYFACSYSKRH